MVQFVGDEIISVHGRRLRIHESETMHELESYLLSSPIRCFTCCPEGYGPIAVGHRAEVTLIRRSTYSSSSNPSSNAYTNTTDIVRLTFSMNPVATLVMTMHGMLVFHEHALGVSIVPFLRNNAFANGFPPSVSAFLKFSCPLPRHTVAPCTLPTCATSPCGRFVAVGVKTPEGPGVQVIALSTATVVAEANGLVSLGGVMSDVMGIFWIPGNAQALLVWGTPRDGPEAIVLLGLDCKLVQVGQPLNIGSRTEIPNEDEGTNETNTNQSDMVQNEDFRFAMRKVGIKVVTITRNGRLAAVGSHDGSVYIFDTLSWTKLFEHCLEKAEIDENHPPAVYIERERLIHDPQPCVAGTGSELGDTTNTSRIRNNVKRNPRRRNVVSKASYFEVTPGVGKVPVDKRPRTRASHEASLLRDGISALAFSPDGRWLFARSDKALNIVHVFDVRHMRLASVIVTLAEVQSAVWDGAVGVPDSFGATDEDCKPLFASTPVGLGSRLGITTSGDSLYVWTEAGVAAVRVPSTLAREHVSENAAPRTNTHVSATEPNGSRLKPDDLRATRMAWGNGNCFALAIDSRASGAFSAMYT